MTRSPKKICVFTATRAEYGLLYWLMRDIQSEQNLELQLIVSGAHLSEQHGLTVMQIEKDGFKIDYKVDLQLDNNDQRIDVAQATGRATQGVAQAIDDLKPDIIVLLGDRYELLGAASAALLMGVPIFHLHGGEVTEGAYDDSIRHAITKLASWHGVANEVYQRRVIQMGEQPETVFNVGGLGLDNINRLSLLSKQALEMQLDFKLGKKTVLVTYHPVTNSNGADYAFDNLLKTLEQQQDITVLFTQPNADHGRADISDKIEKFVIRFPQRSKAWQSLGQLRYLSCLQYIDAVIGNSSSGIIEVPSFDIPTVNIGDRQKGRLRASSVIDCGESEADIELAIGQAIKLNLRDTENPYGSGGAAKKIISIINKQCKSDRITKQFYNLNNSQVL